jgi:L-amino acid N-acyltransferase YncA
MPILRPATAQDVPAMVAIYNQSVAVNTASWDTEPQTVPERRAWFEERSAAGQADPHRRGGRAAWSAGRPGGRFVARRATG